MILPHQTGCNSHLEGKIDMASNSTVYHLTGRQIVLLAFAAAMIAIGVTALLFGLNSFWHLRGLRRAEQHRGLQNDLARRRLHQHDLVLGRFLGRRAGG